MEMTLMRNHFVQGAGLTAFLIGLMLSSGCSNSSLDGPQKVESWKLRSLANGQVVDLADFKGKTVFLNLWATWCPPCVQEMPSIERLAAKFEGNPNVAFVLVSLDQDEDKIQEFIEKKNFHVPIYTPASPTPPLFMERNSIPATFILNANGEIEKKHFESYDWDRKSVVDLIQKLSGSSKG